MATKQWAAAVAAVGAILTAGAVAAQGRVFVFEEETIEGEIEKPEAYYILSPTNLDYESVPPETSFLPELIETVEEETF